MSDPYEDSSVNEELLQQCRQNERLCQESVREYRSGGYHPICLGDSFCGGRYIIKHKLGFGSSSTVWFAEDTMHLILSFEVYIPADSRRQKQWVAIKILSAKATVETKELEVLQLLAQKDAGTSELRHTVQLLDHFTHEGPNGSHLCLVLELLGPTLSWTMEDMDPEEPAPKYDLPPDVIWRISERLLKAIAFLPNAGYKHGDISTGNVAFTCRRCSKMSWKELLDVIGVPLPVDLDRVKGHPGLQRQLLEPIQWPGWYDEAEEDIRVIDIGSFSPKLATPGKHDPLDPWQAPEVILMDSESHKSDLWRAGLVIDSVVTGRHPFLFEFHLEAGCINRMIQLVGDMPPEWQEKWMLIQNRDQYVAQRYTFLKQTF